MQSDTMRLKWSIAPNPNCREVHLSDPLFTGCTEEFNGSLSGRNKDLIDGLRVILGIDTVGVWPYRIHLMKAEVFDWVEITPKVESVIQEWSGQELTVMEPKDWSHIR